MNPAETTVEMSSAREPIQSGECSHCVRNGLLCAFLVAACVLVAYPFANTPFIDDFSYAKTALDFARTGHFHYNGWATAMLGWQIPWGALFIKLFGFSFNVVHLSMLPIDMATVYLFHAVLRRFGLSPGNAVFGALTMALSPLFLPLAASYMSDVPGLFVVVACIYMCQRALAAANNRAAVLWLCFSTAVSVGGGTARQTAWLGALVMVPSTAWLLRNRRGMKTAGILLWILSLVSVLLCMHWFERQPYSVPDPIYQGTIHIGMLIHLAAQLLKTALCLALVVFPIIIVWLPTARRLKPKAWVQFLCTMAAVIAFAIVLYAKGDLDGWLMPWLTPVLAAQHVLILGIFGASSIESTFLLTAFVSFLILASTVIFFLQIANSQPGMLNRSAAKKISWNNLVWILGPFSLVYLMLLAPSGTYSIIQDRYVLGLVPIAIAFPLRLFQKRVTERLSALGVIALAIFAAYAIAGTHDFFSRSRALVSAIQVLQNSGVSRNAIQAGLASDGWVQIERGGFLNDNRIQVPAGAYKPDTYELKIPRQCRSEFESLMPWIQPRYFILPGPVPCFADTRYPQVCYRQWLPPFRGTLYIQQLRPVSR